MPLEDLALIGNCQISALIENTGSIVFCCMPRFDSPPVFGSLLDPAGGAFTIAPPDGSRGEARYLENPNVLETRFTTAEGSFRILDFAPRFMQHERSFRPTMLVRIVEPLEGAPRVVARCEPVLGWSKATPRRTAGSNHVSFEGYPAELRLTTDAPLAYLDGPPFALTQTRRFVLTWGPPVEEALAPLCDRFLGQTRSYWTRWVKHCDVPALYQQAVIRSALVLKLHCYEDTGAIVAAMTTSIPEFAGSGRTWDYRYCWMRDAYYVLGALRLLGHFEERERFLDYLLNIVAGHPALDLSPLYRIDGRSDLDEWQVPNWAGYEGHGPVRVGNAAATHKQNDIYGEIVLALAPLFLDNRFRHEQTRTTLELVTKLARKAIALVGVPDAGIWEYRSTWQPQTFSSLMSWAAADRMKRIVAYHAPELEAELGEHAERIRTQIMATAWNAELGSLTATSPGTSLDASLLQAATLRLLPANDPRIHGTVDAIRLGLAQGDWLFRYREHDGLGTPQVAFVLCTFWLIEALDAIGRTEEARALMDRVSRGLPQLGLIAEDIDGSTGRMWGNFPQAYSHVGLIHAAFAASPPWSEIL